MLAMSFIFRCYGSRIPLVSVPRRVLQSPCESTRIDPVLGDDFGDETTQFPTGIHARAPTSKAPGAQPLLASSVFGLEASIHCVPGRRVGVANHVRAAL